MSLLNDSTHSSPPYLWIQVKQLELECIIGIHEHERHTPQKLVVDLALAVNPTDWLKSGQQGLLSSSINYVVVVDQISQLICAAQFRLLESIFSLLAHLYLSPSCQVNTQAQPQALRLSLHKCHALSPTSKPSPLLSLEISQQAWQQLQDSPLKPSADQDSQALQHSLSQRSGCTVNIKPILILPEVQIYQLDSDAPLNLALNSQESLVPLSDSTPSQLSPFKAIYLCRA